MLDIPLTDNPNSNVMGSQQNDASQPRRQRRESHGLDAPPSSRRGSNTTTRNGFPAATPPHLRQGRELAASTSSAFPVASSHLRQGRELAFSAAYPVAPQRHRPGRELAASTGSSAFPVNPSHHLRQGRELAFSAYPVAPQRHRPGREFAASTGSSAFPVNPSHHLRQGREFAASNISPTSTAFPIAPPHLRLGRELAASNIATTSTFPFAPTHHHRLGRDLAASHLSNTSTFLSESRRFDLTPADPTNLQLLTGGWRHRTFARVLQKTQNSYYKSFAFMLILCTLITPVISFLTYSAIKNPDDAFLDFENTAIKVANLAIAAISGTRELLLFVLAFRVIKKKSIIYPLTAHIIIWAANLAVWIRILYTTSWTSGDIYILSIAGIMSGIQLNTFMLLNAIFDPLIKTTQGVTYRIDDTIPCSAVEKLIDESDIAQKYSVVLKAELESADFDQQGELNHFKFFEFNNKAARWSKKWSSREEDETERVRLKSLLEKLQFHYLIEENDQESERSAPNEEKIAHPENIDESQGQLNDDIEDNMATSENSHDEQGQLYDNNQVNDHVEQQDFHTPQEGVVECLFRTLAQLFEGQKLRGFFWVFNVFAMALLQFWSFSLTGNLLNLGIAVNDGMDKRHDLNMTVVLLVGVLTCNVLTFYASAWLVARLIANAKARLQGEISLRVLYCGPEFEDNFSPGDLGYAFAGSMSKVEALWDDLQFNLMFPLASLFSAVLFFSLLDVGYAMFTVAAIPVVFLLQQVLGRRATAASDRATHSTGLLMGRFQNVVDIHKASKLYQSENFLWDRLSEQLYKSREDNRTSLLWGNVFGAAFNTVAAYLVTITLVVLTYSLSTGKISAGDFVSLTYFVNGTVKPLEQLGLFAGRLAFWSGAIQDVEAVLSYEPKLGGKNDDNNEEVVKDQDEDAACSKAKILSLKRKLDIENVVFKYGEDQPAVLKGVSASMPAGTYNCIFGLSGCGKSTLLTLLEGFNKCTEGRICFDGVDIASVPADQLRQNLGVVFQETHVLDGSILDNIGFGYDKPLGSSRTKTKGKMDTVHVPFPKERIIQAAKDAHIHDFIETLPQKYDTIIGAEADISLSGGQLQRVCGLARALLRNPALLILDEATSALDKISEQAVINTVLALREKGMTTVSVSHHPNTAQNADNILVLDRGLVDQTGTYQELMEEGGIFADLVAAGE